jgi:hypothetical protein
MTLRTNARIAGFTLILYFAAGIASLVRMCFAMWVGAVRIRKTFLGIVGVSTPQVSGATK